MTPTGWGLLVIAVIAVLFGLLFWLSNRIEPDDKTTRNDDWIHQDRRPGH